MRIKESEAPYRIRVGGRFAQNYRFTDDPVRAYKFRSIGDARRFKSRMPEAVRDRAEIIDRNGETKE